MVNTSFELIGKYRINKYFTLQYYSNTTPCRCQNNAIPLPEFWIDVQNT